MPQASVEQVQDFQVALMQMVADAFRQATINAEVILIVNCPDVTGRTVSLYSSTLERGDAVETMARLVGEMRNG